MGRTVRPADQVIDAAIAANPRSAEPREAKGEILWTRGDADGAIRLFDEKRSRSTPEI